MKQIKYTIFFPVILLLMTSCFEDKGNYDYTDIKDAAINIPGVTDQKNVISKPRYTDLVLNPEITFNAGATAAEFDFEWCLYPQSPTLGSDDKYPAAKIIGDKQNLSYHLVDAPNKYYVVLKVKNKETGLVTDYRFQLSVNSVTGWLVYDETSPNNSDFQIIQDNEIVPGFSAAEKGVVRNYFSASNNGEKLPTSKFLGRRTHNSLDHLFLFSENSVVKMGGGTYEVVTKNYSDLFVTPPAVSLPQAYYYPAPVARNVEILINNGVVYTNYYGGMMPSEKFANPISTGMMSYVAAPIIAGIPPVSTNDNTAVLYNSRNKGGFFTISKFNTYAFPATEGLFNTAIINLDATTNLQLQYMGTGQAGVTCAVFRDLKNAGKPWLYQADFRTLTPIAMAKIDLSGLKNIDDAKLFAFGTRGDVMFYATSNGVYSYLFNNTTVNDVLPNVDNIVAMKLYTHSNNEDYSGRILFVATYNGSEGKVYKIRFNELNGQVEGNIEEFTGFGRVIDMMNKE